MDRKTGMLDSSLKIVDRKRRINDSVRSKSWIEIGESWIESSKSWIEPAQSHGDDNEKKDSSVVKIGIWSRKVVADARSRRFFRSFYLKKLAENLF
ncbi:hypothetical protein ACZ11_11670 [Lysinibacillus xylanilyticus]|uniref:Uncharacterized protein n=1 Tax=Lysinibacillus xylanilyticus TaxID=582475 RepID=A0A0K9FE19_9BACI|nr:hypothetical protein ACZ11_11670 [Lysinibacillus xylanilyticus]